MQRIPGSTPKISTLNFQKTNPDLAPCWGCRMCTNRWPNPKFDRELPHSFHWKIVFCLGVNFENMVTARNCHSAFLHVCSELILHNAASFYCVWGHFSACVATRERTNETCLAGLTGAGQQWRVRCGGVALDGVAKIRSFSLTQNGLAQKKPWRTIFVFWKFAAANLTHHGKFNHARKQKLELETNVFGFGLAQANLFSWRQYAWTHLIWDIIWWVNAQTS